MPEMPINGSNNQEILSGKPIISGYGGGGAAVDLAVNNGCAPLSDALAGAMEEYGDTANYHVLVELFRDGVQVPSSTEDARQEAQRLSEIGYVAAMEVYTEEETHGEYITATSHCVLTLHATYDQLADFPASKQFGYYLMLYDEYFAENGILF